MSGGKETPRQKMIGMMYLVLTALLAMNISKDVLLAFITIEEGLGKTNENFEAKNEVLYAKFEKMMGENPTKTGPWKEKAFKIKEEAEAFCKYVDNLKAEVYRQAVPDMPKEVADTLELSHAQEKGVSLDNYDVPTNYLIGEVSNPTGKALELKKKIQEFRELVLSMVPEKEKANFKIALHTEDVYDHHEEKMVPWEVENYNHTTIAACMALLEATKNEVRNAESDIVTILLREIDAGDFKFDKVVAKVVPKSSYVIAGEDFQADIFVAAYSTTQNPVIQVGSGGVDTVTATLKGTPEDVPVSQGLGTYVKKTGAEGLQTWGGVIKVKAPDGSEKSYSFENSYMVAKPSFAVSPTKMNVFYIGVANPVDISVAGAAPSNVVATLSGSGRIDNKGQGHYEVSVTGGTECSINIAVKNPQTNSTKSMGSQKFRIRKIPNPTAKFGGIIGDGALTPGELNAAAGCIADLTDFVFDIKFSVVKWKLSTTVNGLFVDAESKSAAVTSEMKNLMAKAKKGNKVLVEDVYVVGPDGTQRKIPGVNIKVK